MQAIRCPQCGMTNHADDIGYPHCGQCHEDLVRCGYCRHGDASGCRHVKGRAYYTEDGEGAKACPEFRSRHAVREPRLFRQVPAPAWVAAMLLFVLLLVLGAALFVDPAARFYRGSAVRLHTVLPRQVEVGRPFAVTMLITNEEARPSSRIYIEVPPGFMAFAQPVGLPYPEPRRMSYDNGRLLLEYNPIAPAQTVTLQLPFVIRQAGAIPFSARLYAPSHQLRQEVRAIIDVGTFPVNLGMPVP